ncbi:YciI family protein [Ideonella sp. YS5]|uniref:YciI family protein n=1 Tax=Ideonella sp. YS5 TaxID=3453714 RepID=UPI003EEAB7C5
MLFFVTLTYVRPAEEVAEHLGTHKDWLDQQISAGRIVVAGPLEDRSGGALLADCADRGALDAMLAQDSFQVHRLVQTRVQVFQAALHSPSWH